MSLWQVAFTIIKMLEYIPLENVTALSQILASHSMTKSVQKQADSVKSD